MIFHHPAEDESLLKCCQRGILAFSLCLGLVFSSLETSISFFSSMMVHDTTSKLHSLSNDHCHYISPVLERLHKLENPFSVVSYPNSISSESFRNYTIIAHYSTCYQQWSLPVSSSRNQFQRFVS